MRNAYAVGRVQLKSKLLIGVAGLVAAGSTTAAAADASAPATQAPKWLPYADVGAGIGDGFTQGKVDLFIPVWQDIDSLFFGRIGVGTQTHNDEILNVGVGYRTKVDPEWILGLYAGIDNTHTDFGHNFSRYSVGAEMMSADWDVRVNGYSAKHDPRPITTGLGNQYELYIHDTQIGILQAEEAAYSGFDGEVGYRVFSTDNTDVRLFAGGFVFHNNYHTPMFDGQNFNLKYPTMSGPRGRAEVNVFDIDVLGEQSRLSFDGEITHDKVRGTSGFAGATLRIPLGASSGEGAQTLDDLDRRMADPVRRQDDVLTHWQFDKPEPVIIYNGTITSEPTNTLYYVDNHMGHGSYADPTTLKDATDRGPVNQFVVLTDHDGPVDSTGVEVQYGETVVGPGIFSIRGVNSGEVFTHDFAPGSGPVSITSSDPNVITLDANTNLFGITIDAPFVNAIYGHNINDVVIGNVTIDGGGTGTNGIYIVQDAGGPADISIYNTTIENVTHDGVSIDITNDTGGSASFDLNVTDLTTSGIGNDGVSVSSVTSGSSTSTVYAGIHDSTISGGASDVIMTGTVYAGSSLTQTLVVDPTTLSGGDFGVFVDGYSDGGTLNQTVNISDVTTSDNYIAGIYVKADGVDGANVTQHVNLTNVTVYGPGGEPGFGVRAFDGIEQVPGGIVILANAEGASTVTQTAALSNVTVHGVVTPHYEYYGEGDGYSTTYTGTTGIVILANALGESTVTQTATLSDITVDNAFYGIRVGAFANGDSTINQTVTMDGVTVHGQTRTNTNYVYQTPYCDGDNCYGGYYNAYTSTVGTYGIRVAAYAYDGSTVTQGATLSNINIDGGAAGIQIGAFADDATTHQTFSLTDATVTGAYYDNIDIVSIASHSGTVHQYGTFDGVTASNSEDGDGLQIVDVAEDGATAIQRLGITNFAADNNYQNGVDICGIALGVGAAPVASVGDGLSCVYGSGIYYGAGVHAKANTSKYYLSDTPAIVAQYVSIAGATMNGNNYSGALALVGGLGYGSARQDVSITFSEMDDNGGVGFGAVSAGILLGTAQQNIYLGYDDISGNTYRGAVFAAVALGLGSAQQTVNVYETIVNNNGGDGIAVAGYAKYAGQVLQNVGLYNVTATGNAGDGLHIETNAYGYATGSAYTYYSHVGQNVIAAYDSFSSNTGNGVEISNYAGYGAQVDQFVYLINDTINDNGFSEETLAPLVDSPISSGSGVYEYSKAEAYGYDGGKIQTNVYAELYVVDSTANGNYGDGITVKGYADGPTYLIQHIYVQGTDANENGRTGFVSYVNASNFYSFDQQYVTLSNSQFNGNTLDGAAFLASQHYGPLSFGASVQSVTIQDSTFSYNTRDGLYADADAYALQGRAEQHFVISGSTFDNNGGDGIDAYSNAHDGVLVPASDPGTYYTCDTIQGVDGGCAFVRQTINISYSDISHNTGDGIYVGMRADNYGAVYNSSGRPYYTPTLYVSYSTVSNNGGDGVHLENNATNNSYIYSYALLSNSHFDHNGGDGVEVNSTADGNSTVLQGTILYASTELVAPAFESDLPGISASSADYNTGDGVHVYSTATGGSLVQQLVGVYGSDVSNNDGHGLSVGMAASDSEPSIYPSVVAQYVKASTSTFNHNGKDGIYLDRQIHDGVYVAGYPCSAVQGEDGGCAVGQQTVNIANSDISSNTGDGIYVKTHVTNYGAIYANPAHGAGATIYLLDDTATYNGGDGVHAYTHLDSHAYGYQYVEAVDSTFDHNDGSGVHVSSYVNNGASLKNHVTLYSLGATTSTSYNGQDGVLVGTKVRSGVYGYGQATTTVNLNGYDGQGIDANYNTDNGILLSDVVASGTAGSYTHSTLTVSNSEANHNYGGVVLFANGRGAVQTATITDTAAGYNNTVGLGGVVLHDGSQTINVTDGDFSHNTQDGIYLLAVASGSHAYVDQYVTITGATIDYNGHNGIHIYDRATGGTYVVGNPCTVAQGGTGGCAIVRQTVSVTGGDISHNTDNGVFLATYANNYGAIYGAHNRPHVPTLELHGTTIDNNGARGVDVSNHVSGHSYLYQYVDIRNTAIDHNLSDGVYSASYVGGASTMLQRAVLYAYDDGTASASYNAGNGFKSSIEALGGSYARDVNVVTGVDLSHDGSFGFDAAVAYADGTSTGLQINHVYTNTINHNGDGIGLYSIGSGAQQMSYLGDNTVTYNSFIGIYGEANFNAFMYIGVYTFGNTVNHSGTHDYFFHAYGGATQILN